MQLLRPSSSPQPLNFHRMCKQIPISILFCLVHTKVPHLYVNELCPSRLILCNISGKLKRSTFKISQKVQINFNYNFFLLNIHEILSSTFFVSPLKAIQPYLSHPTMLWNRQHKSYNTQYKN